MFGDDRNLVSLMDLLACAFGAAVILAVIFMVSNDSTNEEAFAGRGFVMHLQIDGDAALFSLLVKPPGETEFIDINPAALPQGSPTDCGIPGANVCILYGWSLDGESHVRPQEGDSQDREYLVVFPSPIEGQWQVGVRYMTRQGDPRTWDDPIPRARIRGGSLTGLELEADPCAGLLGRELGLGETAFCESFVVERME